MVNGDSITYVQGATDYTNCVWTTSCAEGTLATVTFTDFLSEGGWDFLNVHSAVAGVSNSIGPAVHNGGIDNSGDLGRFSGNVDDFSLSGVAAFQFITDWSYQEPGAGFTAVLTCLAPPTPGMTCNVEDLVLDWAGGFHASGHAVFDDNAMVMDGVEAAGMVVADPLDGCMGGADGGAAATLTGNFASKHHPWGPYCMATGEGQIGRAHV